MSYESQTILDTIKEINHVYYLPSIQRKFVWEKEQIEYRRLADVLDKGNEMRIVGRDTDLSISYGGI